MPYTRRRVDASPGALQLGIRKGQLRRTPKRHVLISGDAWKLRWPGEETKNGEPHEVKLWQARHDAHATVTTLASRS